MPLRCLHLTAYFISPGNSSLIHLNVNISDMALQSHSLLRRDHNIKATKSGFEMSVTKRD